VRVEQVTDPVAYHGEGPVWSKRWGGLRWVDMLAGDVLSLAADGTVERRHVGTVAAALRPRSRGGAVIGVERGFALEDADGTLTHLDELWSDEGVRMNEGAATPTVASTAGRRPTTSVPEPPLCTGWTPTSPCASS
jgi:sugar lactone lactonase YvrE